MQYTEELLGRYRAVNGTRNLKTILALAHRQRWLRRGDLQAMLLWYQKHPEYLTKSFIEFHLRAVEREGELVQLFQELVSMWNATEQRDITLERSLPEGFSSFCNQEAPLGSKPVDMVAPGVRFMREDHNPYNCDNAHPDVAFVAYDLGGKSREEWIRQFTNAFEMLANTVPTMYRRMLPFVDGIVPMGYVPERQLSSAYKESPGVLYLSYTDLDRKQAEALVHEIHHTIYNAIDASTPILHNGDEERYISGYRPDPRHMRGCLLGLHAFTAVQEFYSALMNEASAAEQQDLAGILAHIYEQNRVTLKTVKTHGKLSAEGKLLLQDCEEQMEQCQDTYEQIPATIRQKARQAIDLHVATVKKSLSPKS